MRRTGIFAFGIALASTTALVPVMGFSAEPEITELGYVAPLSAWEVKNMGAAAAGASPYCAMIANYEKGVMLAVARNGEGFGSIAMDFEQSFFEPGTKYPIGLSVDNKSTRHLQAAATGGRSLIVQLGQDSEFFNALKRDGRLDVALPQTGVSFSLRGFSRHNAKFEDCAQVPESDRTRTAGASKEVVELGWQNDAPELAPKGQEHDRIFIEPEQDDRLVVEDDRLEIEDDTLVVEDDTLTVEDTKPQASQEITWAELEQMQGAPEMPEPPAASAETKVKKDLAAGDTGFEAMQAEKEEIVAMRRRTRPGLVVTEDPGGYEPPPAVAMNKAEKKPAPKAAATPPSMRVAANTPVQSPAAATAVKTASKRPGLVVVDEAGEDAAPFEGQRLGASASKQSAQAEPVKKSVSPGVPMNPSLSWEREADFMQKRPSWTARDTRVEEDSVDELADSLAAGDDLPYVGGPATPVIGKPAVSEVKIRALQADLDRRQRDLDRQARAQAQQREWLEMQHAKLERERGMGAGQPQQQPQPDMSAQQEAEQARAAEQARQAEFERRRRAEEEARRVEEERMRLEEQARREQAERQRLAEEQARLERMERERRAAEQARMEQMERERLMREEQQRAEAERARDEARRLALEEHRRRIETEISQEKAAQETTAMSASYAAAPEPRPVRPSLVIVDEGGMESAVEPGAATQQDDVSDRMPPDAMLYYEQTDEAESADWMSEEPWPENDADVVSVPAGGTGVDWGASPSMDGGAQNELELARENLIWQERLLNEQRAQKQAMLANDLDASSPALGEVERRIERLEQALSESELKYKLLQEEYAAGAPVKGESTANAGATAGMTAPAPMQTRSGMVVEVEPLPVAERSPFDQYAMEGEDTGREARGKRHEVFDDFRVPEQVKQFGRKVKALIRRGNEPMYPQEYGADPNLDPNLPTGKNPYAAGTTRHDRLPKSEPKPAPAPVQDDGDGDIPGLLGAPVALTHDEQPAMTRKVDENARMMDDRELEETKSFLDDIMEMHSGKTGR